ncbi:hypothetical protein SFR_4321 [Streptomyces sp. FR-008]|nr:hypothetical protein SFR_4321 [Streptomyces sp. FR-008]
MGARRHGCPWDAYGRWARKSAFRHTRARRRPSSPSGGAGRAASLTGAERARAQRK